MKIDFLKSNRNFFYSLEKSELKLFLLILSAQLITYFYLLTTIPLHYDEWFSLTNFSGTTFWNIFTNYPSPNNHVFYNLVSRLFVLLPIDSEIAIRLPSLLASMLTSYYFYKLCRFYFNSSLSLPILILLISLHQFAFYSIEARGYSFINLFCVLLLYSSMKLAISYSTFKHRFLFIIAQFLGFFTLPNFLYIQLPVSIALFVYLISQRAVKSVIYLLQDTAISAILVIIGYSGILFYSDSTAIFNLQMWVNKFTFTDPNWFENLILYLDARFYGIFGFYRLKTFSALLLFTIIYYTLKGNHTEKFMILLCAFMFCSPLLIVLVQKLYPMERTLYFLQLPVLILCGFMINTICQILCKNKIVFWLSRYAWVFCVILLGIAIFKITSLPAKKRETMAWDYKLNWLRKTKMKPVMSQYQEIARTNIGFEFFIADEISFMCRKENPATNIHITLLEKVKDQDILIMSGKEKSKYLKDLTSYKLLYEFDDIWIYQSNKINKQGLANRKSFYCSTRRALE